MSGSKPRYVLLVDPVLFPGVTAVDINLEMILIISRRLEATANWLVWTVDPTSNLARLLLIIAQVGSDAGGDRFGSSLCAVSYGGPMRDRS